jgi:aerobic-type carbon monoxide dehydrogenase small subunit (CoxS/CutS family)
MNAATSLVTERMITVTVNGTRYERVVPVRRLLTDFLREDLGLTGTHVGCEHGVCGACTILLDGASLRACLLLAVQVDGAELLTVEGLAKGDELHPVQEAFWQEHGLQCGFCTPGMLLTTYELLRDTRSPSEEQIRLALSGNLCRCTGYQNIVKSVATADRLWER